MTNINVSVLNGRNGFIIQGIAQDGRLGDAVSDAGDVNGDGLADILIGARDVDISGDNNEGQVSVIFGSSDGFSSQLAVSEIDEDNGFQIDGISEEQRLGIAVSSAGDVNGDEFADIIIGANGTNDNTGSSYLILGNSDIDDVNISALDGTNGFAINGVLEGDFFGGAVSSAGDINNDGFDDIAIAANFADANGNENAGATYVIFGTEAGFSEEIDVALLDGGNGFTLNGVDPDDFSGISISSAGDINGDERDDLLIGASFADPDEESGAGTTYVVFGSDTFTRELNLSILDENSLGFTINGIVAGDASGTSVAGLGDINNDGFADIGIGAPSADSDSENAGQAYVVFGTETGFNEEIFLENLDGSEGFTINGANTDDQLGISISSAGDVNNDSIDDFIIGAVGANAETGSGYVIFGEEDTEFAPTLELSDLNFSQGFSIDGENLEDRVGESVSGIGDVNDDGIGDLLIGAPQASPNGVRDAGEAYVVFGRIENLGDADNDGDYTDRDAYLISRVAVGLDSEFEAYPGIDPLLVADVNSDGVISAFDSAIIFYTANGIECSCALPDIGE